MIVSDWNENDCDIERKDRSSVKQWLIWHITDLRQDVKQTKAKLLIDATSFMLRIISLFALLD